MGGSSCQPQDLKCSCPEALFTIKERRRKKKKKQNIYTPKTPFEMLLETDTRRRMSDTEFYISINEAQSTHSLGFLIDSPEIWENRIWKNYDFREKRFLDIGCGAMPHDVFYLWLKGVKLAVGIDISPFAIACCNDQLEHLEFLLPSIQFNRFDFYTAWLEARDHLPNFHNITNIKFANFLTTDIPDNYFDIVNLSWISSGRTDEEMIREALRVCRIGGIVRQSDCWGERYIEKNIKNY